MTDRAAQPVPSRLATALAWGWRLTAWTASIVAVGLLLWLIASFAGLQSIPPRNLRILVWPGLPILTIVSTMLQLLVQVLRWRFRNLRLLEWGGWMAFAGLLLIVVTAAYVDAPEWAINGVVGAAFAIAFPLMFLALRRKWRGV